MSGSTTPPLPRSDLFVIPLLVLLTLAGLFGIGEFTARTLFVESGVETCGGVAPSGVTAMRPNCQSHRKAAEGPDTVNVYNDCGYRSPEPCRSRTANGIRVALMGASTAQGLKVRYPDSFAARLTNALSTGCHRPVEFQNMGVAGAGLLDIYRRLDEALALNPDLVMIVLTPYEMKAVIDRQEMARRDAPLPSNPGSDATVVSGVPATLVASVAPPVKSLVARISDLAFNSRILVVAQHYLFQDRPTFVRLFMLHGEDADYLRVPYGSGWEQRLNDFDTLLSTMAARSKAAGVGLFIALGPQRIQASLLDRLVLAPGVDPFEIGRRIGAIAERHGVLFQDTLTGFAKVADPDGLFYAVDGHMDAGGHAVFAGSVLNRLISDSALFQDCHGATVAASVGADS
jgi:hypothetical protein